MSHITIVCDLLSTFLRFRRFIALGLVRTGHRVTLIVSDCDEQDLTFFSQHDIELRVVPMNRTGLNPVQDWRYCQELKRHLRELQPDRILSYQAKAAVWSAVAARAIPKCHVSILFPGLGYLFSPNPTLRQRIIQTISRKLYRYAFRSIDSAIFQNKDDIATLKFHNILSPQTNFFLVNGSGVSLDEFPYSQTPIEPVRFVMATRLLADKGIREFAIASKTLKERYGSDVDFQIAGSLDSNPTAIKKSEIDHWESSGWITYRGNISDMPKFLKECSVFVLPSWYMEGTPRSILEAMSTGRAIITTDNRGCKETVDHGENGLIVEQQNALALEQAMNRLIMDHELLLKMGKASRRIAKEKYEINMVCQQMYDAMGLRSEERPAAP